MRDMEGEVIHMCEDQGMAVIPWGALGSGSLLTAEQRKARENDPDAPDTKPSETALRTSEALGKIAARKGTTLQAIVSHLAPIPESALRPTGPCIPISPDNLCLPHRRRQHG